MNISFQWGDNSNRITPEQKVRVEENIRTEISNSLEQMKNQSDELLVHLFPDMLCLSLEGTATNAVGANLVKITYSLRDDHLRSYSFFGCAYSDSE